MWDSQAEGMVLTPARSDDDDAAVISTGSGSDSRSVSRPQRRLDWWKIGVIFAIAVAIAALCMAVVVYVRTAPLTGNSNNNNNNNNNNNDNNAPITTDTTPASVPTTTTTTTTPTTTTPRTTTTTSSAPSTSVLFVGNSFTYGPSKYGGQHELNNLPRLFTLVAESMGKTVVTGEDTIGGCTLFTRLPSRNPEGAAPCICPERYINSSACYEGVACDAPTYKPPSCLCDLVDNPRVSPDQKCTVPKGAAITDDHHPCPQLIHRGPEPGKSWDIVVLQEYSVLATVEKARHRYFEPSVQEFVEVAKRQGAKVAGYVTWPYPNGTTFTEPYLDERGSHCPFYKDYHEGCFPFGNLDDFSECKLNDDWYNKVPTQACVTYALARGYEDVFKRAGADFLVPAGAAWLLARGLKPSDLPDTCAGLIDAEYDGPPNLPPFPLEPPAEDPYDGRWADEAFLQMYRYKYAKHPSPFFEGSHVDNHPSLLGMYLNACVFYASIFGESPVGAAIPNGQEVAGFALPGEDTIRGDGTKGAMTSSEALMLQHLAAQAVLPYHDKYWKL